MVGLSCHFSWPGCQVEEQDLMRDLCFYDNCCTSPLYRLLTWHVRCCVPGQKIVIVREDQAKKENGPGGAIRLDHRSLQDVTLDHLVTLVKKLGSKVNYHHNIQAYNNQHLISGESYRSPTGRVLRACQIFLQLHSHSRRFRRTYGVCRKLQV